MICKRYLNSDSVFNWNEARLFAARASRLPPSPTGLRGNSRAKSGLSPLRSLCSTPPLRSAKKGLRSVDALRRFSAAAPKRGQPLRRSVVLSVPHALSAAFVAASCVCGGVRSVGFRYRYTPLHSLPPQPRPLVFVRALDRFGIGQKS